MKPLAPLSALIHSVSLSDSATLATIHACEPAQLVQTLTDTRHWYQHCLHLPRGAYALLDRIRRVGGSGTMAWLDGLAGPLRTNISTISPRTLLTIYSDHTPLETLYMMGLLWPSSGPHGDTWAIPPEIDACLPDIRPLLETSPYAIDAADDVIDSDEMLCQVACLAYDGRIPLQHQGKVSQVVMQRIADTTVSPSYIRWLVACLLAGGACVAEHNHVVPAQPLLSWLEMPAHLRRQELARAWLQAAWSEWELGPKRRPPALDVRAARRTVLHEFVPHLTDTWCAVDDILIQIKSAWPDLFRSERNRLSHGWQTTWDENDGQLLRYFIMGPLCWLGIIESAHDGVVVRRTALGRWLAGIATPPPVTPIQAASMEADFSVVLPDRRNILARFQLHRIATWQDDITAQLSPQRVAHALAKGMTINEYCAIVQQVTWPSPDDEMLATIRRWGAAVNYVQMTPMVLIHATSNAIVHDLRNDRRVNLPTHTWIGDNHIGIDPADAPAVARRLRMAGYVVETARLRPAAFSDDELALIESALQQLDAQSDAARQLQLRVAQLRMARRRNSHG